MPSLAQTSRRRELLAVSAIVLAISAILWWRLLPLPHQDLDFYTEPSYLLANSGKLAGPGSQNVDLTYQKGIYNYPPGHYVILAAWIKIFGLSPDSLLAYTHTLHSGILIALWALLRFRYSCSRWISSLVLLATFPRMAHGRPDLLACLLSLAAWLALTLPNRFRPLIVSGCIAGLTLWTSPGYGLSILVTLAVLICLDSQSPLRSRLRALAVWAVSAGSLFAVLLAVVLAQQHAWTLAYWQFTVNASIRGAQVNVWPDFHLFFTFVFSVVPFLLLALLPAMLAAFVSRRKGGPLFAVSLAFLAATAIWLLTNKSQLLLEHHYLFPAKSVFLGVFLASWRAPVWLRALPLLLLSFIGFYLYKSDFLYLSSPLRQWEHLAVTSVVHPQGELAVDSLFFARCYAPGRTLNYETVGMNFWPRYLAAMPSSVLADLPPRPVEPSVLMLSRYTLGHYGPMSHLEPQCIQSPQGSEPLHRLGRNWNLPANPYAIIVCPRPQP